MGASAATDPPPSSCELRVEHLPCIDVRNLSQSELLALSFCSDSFFDPRRTDDVVVPQINKSLFNESAGSRRQTYSRSRIRHSQHHRARLPGLLRPNSNPQTDPSSDPTNRSIIHHLKNFINQNSTADPPARPEAGIPENSGLGLEGFREKESNSATAERKRKRRSEKIEASGVGVKLEILNRNGEAIDFGRLEMNGDELYGNELRKRTVGLDNEEGALGFLRGLEGDWCSRRKKRKYVDASVFGDVLPVGWKLLLALRRRDGLVSVYCRRFVSPNGQQFVSCKEASSFLNSYFMSQNATEHVTTSNQPTDGSAPVKNTGILCVSAGGKRDLISVSDIASSTTLDRPVNEVNLMGIDNLPEVQIHDLYECYKCNLSFDGKDAYFKHLLSVHKQTTRRFKVGRPVGKGVIFKDGKYECQFCHKIFEEKRSYTGHVGVHVRSNSKGSGELTGLGTDENKMQILPVDEHPSKASKMDAVTEIGQDSILENPSAGTTEKIVDESSPPEHIYADDANPTLPRQADQAGDTSGSNGETEMEDCQEGKSEGHAVDLRDSKCTTADERSAENLNKQDMTIDVIADSAYDSWHHVVNDMEKYPNNELELQLKDSQTDNVTDRMELQFFPSSATISDKGESEFSMMYQNREETTGFEGLTFDEIEPFKYDFVDPEVSMDLADNPRIDEAFNASAGFNSEAVMSDTTGTNQQTTVCVWCREEFKLEGIDVDTLSDSIGFMCPTCKTKISGIF